MIILFTDFGPAGPYTGQMKAVLAQQVPQVPVIDLMVDVPAHDVTAAAHLLATYHAEFPANSVFLCVIDPGVGSDSREPIILHADGHWYVGPGNGLFDVVAARSACVEAWRVTWRPEHLSNSFHGRDMFAPVAAMIAGGEFPQAERIEFVPAAEVAQDYSRVIYIDHFGNLLTGLRASSARPDQSVEFKGQRIPRVRTFSDVHTGQPLCYENSSGLIEIAVNCGRADIFFKASIGDLINLV
jgi:S-adenosylmethionine hydrolase